MYKGKEYEVLITITGNRYQSTIDGVQVFGLSFANVPGMDVNS